MPTDNKTEPKKRVRLAGGSHVRPDVHAGILAEAQKSGVSIGNIIDAMYDNTVGKFGKGELDTKGSKSK